MAQIHQVRFTRDFSCFTCCGEDGCRVFNVEPLLQLTHITAEEIGCGKVLQAELLKRTNLLALVCKDCDYAVKIWDCLMQRARREVTFDEEVTNIKFHHDKLIVVLRSKVLVFSYSPDLQTIANYDTRLNPLGVVAVNSGAMSQILAFPSCARLGAVQVEDLMKRCTLATVSAHEHDLACVTLNSDGSKMATASRHGTIIRLFSVEGGQKLLELRRGSNTAFVYSLNFSIDSSFLCAASDKGTVHVFAVLNSSLNRKSALEMISPGTAYTSSLWGVSNFTVPAELACICCFLRDKRTSVLVICVDGSYHRYSFSPDASTCKPESYEKFIELGDSMEM